MSDIKIPSRREFLESSAALAGFALVGGLGVSRTAHAAGTDQLKIALIGCGFRGTGAVANCLESCENVKLVVMADAFPEKIARSLKNLRKGLAARYDRNSSTGFLDQIDVPPERQFSGFDAYQRAISAGVDIVLLTTPPGFRPMHYAAAIEGGKHVFMEKPVCVDAPGYRLVRETNKLADHKGLNVAVGFQRRHSKEFIEPVNAIHDGALGDLFLLRAYWNQAPTWVRARKPNETEMEYQMRNWYHFVWLSGDHICEQHAHNLDVCNWVKGEHPVKANGMGSCHIRDNRGIGQIYDNHFVEFVYKDGTRMYSQCRQQPNQWDFAGQFVHGAKGVKELPGNGKDGYIQAHVHLVNAIRKGERLNDGWFAADSSMTAVLGRMATYSGLEVDWDEAVAKGPNEMPERLAFDANPKAMPDENGCYSQPMPGVYTPYL